MYRRAVIKKAWILSLAGLIPFIWLTVEQWVPSLAWMSAWSAQAADWLFVAYAAVILSFLGGTSWMHALFVHGHSRLAGWLLCYSVMPALAAWVALCAYPQPLCWLVLLGSFAAQLRVEHTLHHLGLMLMKQLSWRGVTLRALPLADKARLMDAMKHTWWPSVCDGVITPHLHAVIPLTDVADAHAQLQARTVTGKIILRCHDGF